MLQSKELENLKLIEKVKELNTHIENCKKEVQRIHTADREKEKKIYEYKVKISDLQKTKQILTYRAAELKKGLQPKENQIQQLKMDIIDLEKEFESNIKLVNEYEDKIKKKDDEI